MKRPIIAVGFLLMSIILVPNAYARADLFVGELKEHELAGHGEGGGLYIPTSYTGISETYTMVVRNDRGRATTEVQIILPQGMEFISAREQVSWKLTVLKPPSVPTPVLIWNGSSISKGKSEQFAFRVMNPPDLFVYYFVVVQTYQGGENDVWRPWVQIINPTNIAGIEFSTIAALIVPLTLALPIIERGLSTIRKKS